MSTEGRRQRSTPSAFGRLLKRLRLGADLTQEELAERAGVSTRLISDLERGIVQHSRRDTVEMLADGLGLEGTERATFSALARRRAAAISPETGFAPAPLANLPPQPNDIIGREREISATTSLLLQPETRLLTLTGPGGVGKTRLAIEAGAQASTAFSDGVVFIELTPLRDPRLVMPAIARALQLPGEEEPTVDDVARELDERHVLLLIDNLEHLVDAAVEIAQLVERCPRLKVLATSRQLLRIRFEREYPVGPLTRSQAVQLFVQRAEAARPDIKPTSDYMEEVAAIVTRLDGLPLAIELAAGRMRLLTPGDLLSRLDRSLPLLTSGPRDTPQRQHTLRSTIDWSYDLLSPAERQVFSWLAVFAGGFTLNAAEFVVRCTDMEQDTLETISSLVDKNLIENWRADADKGIEPAGTSNRFRMLETIREYALERLDNSNDRDEARKQHAKWCADLAKRSEDGLNSPEQVAWLNRLIRENDNFRAALTWTISAGEADLALQIAGWLLRFWATSGQFVEARRWYESVLALESPFESIPRAKTLLGVQVISYFQGNYDSAQAYGEEALRLYTALDDPTGIGSSYGNLGLLADAREDYVRATELYERALAIFREIDDRKHTQFMLGNLGLIAHLQGDQDRAADLLEESLALSRELGDVSSIAINLSNLGSVAHARHDLDTASAYQHEALALRRTLNNPSAMTRSFDHLAAVASTRREYQRAARLFAAAEALRAELGTSLQPNDREVNRPYIEAARDALGDARFASAWETGATMPLDEVTTYALEDDRTTARSE